MLLDIRNRSTCRERDFRWRCKRSREECDARRDGAIQKFSKLDFVALPILAKARL